jgi:hypothetical protein
VGFERSVKHVVAAAAPASRPEPAVMVEIASRYDPSPPELGEWRNAR